MERINKYYYSIMQASVVVLGVGLFWFAFVYYPSIVSDLRQGKNIPTEQIFSPVSASSVTFPVETKAYRIEYDNSGGYYLVSVSGNSVAEFLFNKDNANLALKSALSAEKLCGEQIVYVSSTGLDVPSTYSQTTDCN